MVLAVSAALFFSAVVAFSGRQQEVQFNQAVRDFDSRLLDYMNDVSTGFFSNDGTLRCTVNSVSGVLSISGGSDEQGSSDDCVFIGKVLQFEPQGDGADHINVINVLGRREGNSGASINSLQEANPKGVADSVRSVPLEWGLKVTAVKSGGASNLGSIGFFTPFSTAFGITQSNATVSNNQQVNFWAINGSRLNESEANALSHIENINSEPTNDPITICLEKADSSKTAAIVIGEGGTSGTTMHFDDEVADDCE